MIALPEAAKSDSMGFALRLVKEARIAVAPGVTFGTKGEGHVRLSLCSSEETICEGLKRLAEVYQQL
jgi:aspartate/methionine/tyrosine aminotransferase